MRNQLPPAEISGALAMARWWPYQPLTAYPHMMPADRAVWDPWITDHPDAYLAVTYDSRLGDPWSLPGRVSDQLRRIAAGLTRLRSDVIGWTGQELHVIEIKPEGSPAGLGQSIVYATLLDITDPQEPPIRPALLATWYHPAIQQAAQALGVLLL